MSVKVKRGLGLLVVAVIAFLIGTLIDQADRSGGLGAFVGIAYVLSALVMLGAFCGGLVLLAWGLLRE